MNISMKFISRYVDLPADLTYDQIAYDLTMRTVEVEDVIDTAAKVHDIVVGEIKEVHVIDKDKCIKCGTCISKCPFKAIS